MFERLPDLLTFKECQQALQIGKNSLSTRESLTASSSAADGEFTNTA